MRFRASAAFVGYNKGREIRRKKDAKQDAKQDTKKDTKTGCPALL